ESCSVRHAHEKRWAERKTCAQRTLRQLRFFASLLKNKSVVRTAHATSLFLRGSISAQRYGVLRMTG
ncbi:MAG TPA: hypothetical protein VGX03_03255, partial [Candidatus Binatia bacterium]|nr:hypothetical protein [Candidatus Binatia bacterium]